MSDLSTLLDGALMAADLSALVDDLVAESAVLDAVLEGLRPAQWSLATPAAGWSVGDQVSHLAYFDGTTLQSLVDPEQFRLDAEALTAGGDDFSDRIAAAHRRRPVKALLGWFRTARAALVDAYRAVDPGRRLPWYGPDMTPASSITARLMETWAHGQDIVDTSGVRAGCHSGGCVTSPIWASVPCRTAMPSTTSRRPPSRSGSSWTHRTGANGAGGRRTPSIA